MSTIDNNNTDYNTHSTPGSVSTSDNNTLRQRSIKPSINVDTDDDINTDNTHINNSSSLDGLTDDGTKFVVPDTLNTVTTFQPQNIGLVSALTILCLSISAYTVFFCNYTKWLHIIIFFIFRCSYDIGLGIILRNQSQYRTVTKWYIKQRGYSTEPTSLYHKVLDHVASYQLPITIRNNLMLYPVDFRAWLVYKSLVNFILVQDGLNYILLAIRLFKVPDHISLLLLLQYTIGIVLCVFNMWAKQDAHRCIGEYSWYWGDFFFRKQADLVFDGIFELFPHPMYTVGYSIYYGLTLLCSSYTLLFVSLTAHALQLIFLFVVEEPHIERTYGKPQDNNKLDNKYIRQLYHTEQELNNDSIFYYKLKLTRLSDAVLIVISIYVILFSILLNNQYKWLNIIHVLLWRVIHWLGIGSLLWLQSNRQYFVRLYATQGYTLADSFSVFRGVYNISYTINLLVFICCAYQYMSLQLVDLASPSVVARTVCGLILIVINIWSYISTYNAVGNFGWYYGDFFIQQSVFTNTTLHRTHTSSITTTSTPSTTKQQQTMQQTLTYTGIYRFLNNPDCITGYMGLYGMSMICSSWTIFTLALISHACQVLFLYIVEIPHMNRIYSSSNQLRHVTPAVNAISKLTTHVTNQLINESESARQLKYELDEAEQKIKYEIRKIRLKTSTELLSLYKRLLHNVKQKRINRTQQQIKNSVSQQQINNDQLVQLHAPEQISIGDSLYVRFEADEQHSDTDWLGVYSTDTPSVPSSSDGHWLYVPTGKSGQLCFPATLLPQQEGVYEIRYHRDNNYDVVTAIPLIISNNNIQYTNMSPRNGITTPSNNTYSPSNTNTIIERHSSTPLSIEQNS